MLSIQDVGKQIISNNPLKFYVFAGNEFGIKTKYINMLESYYGHKEEYQDVDTILNYMKTKHIIPLSPAVYVVRYDDQFVSSLNNKSQEYIDSINIVGTIICIYESPKQISKLSKYLSNYTVSIDKVDSKFVNKYLHEDFPRMPDNYIKYALEISTDYNQAYNICNCLSYLSNEELYKLSRNDIYNIFGYKYIAKESDIKIGIASKNFKFLSKLLEEYGDSADSIVYMIMSTMIELDKLLNNKYSDSILRPYINNWSRPDIYYMFKHSYNELKKLRRLSISDPMNSVIYLFGLLQFSSIPSEDMMS